MIRLDGEGQTTQALRAARAHVAAEVVGRGLGRPLQALDRLVDLDADAGPALRVVVLGLRQDQVPGQFRRGERRADRALPVGLTTLALGPADQHGDEDDGEHEGDGQDDPAPRCRRRRRRRLRRGRGRMRRSWWSTRGWWSSPGASSTWWSTVRAVRRGGGWRCRRVVVVASVVEVVSPWAQAVPAPVPKRMRGRGQDQQEHCRRRGGPSSSCPQPTDVARLGQGRLPQSSVSGTIHTAGTGDTLAAEKRGRPFHAARHPRPALHVARRTRGDGPTFTSLAQTAEAIGVRTLSVMDHWFQMEMLWPAEEPMLEGYTTLSFAAAKTERLRFRMLVGGVTYRHPGLAGQDHHDTRRALGRSCRAGPRRRLVRAGAPRPRRPLPTPGRALRTARGDAADLSSDVERRQRPLRGQALPVGRDLVRAQARQLSSTPGAHRRRRGAQDAPPRGHLRRRLQHHRRRVNGGPQGRGTAPSLRGRRS